jgi:hypothetical protein
VTKTIPTDRARQGKGGRQVLLVLLGALALAAVAWLGVELYGEAIDPPASDLPVQSQPG